VAVRAPVVLCAEADGSPADRWRDLRGERQSESLPGPPAAGLRAARGPTRQTATAMSATAAARKIAVSRACSGQ
jgi:hypothetical protein